MASKDDANVRARWRVRLAKALRDQATHSKAVAAASKAATSARKVIARHTPKPVPSGNALWHPDAKRVPHQDAGMFTGGGHKIVWHTTEGSNLPAYGGSAPHFTLNPQTGVLWQHISLNRAARALLHPSGTPETNRANVIQVELIGFARDTGRWPDLAYRRVATLARWIEANAGVPRKCSVEFSGTAGAARRLSGQAFFAYAGHCGHQHVPGNAHWDPGMFRIDKVLTR